MRGGAFQIAGRQKISFLQIGLEKRSVFRFNCPMFVWDSVNDDCYYLLVHISLMTGKARLLPAPAAPNPSSLSWRNSEDE
jgi:hypothetical protein